MMKRFDPFQVINAFILTFLVLMLIACTQWVEPHGFGSLGNQFVFQEWLAF